MVAASAKDGLDSLSPSSAKRIVTKILDKSQEVLYYMYKGVNINGFTDIVRFGHKSTFGLFNEGDHDQGEG